MAVVDGCDLHALGLGASKRLPAWLPPPGCSFAGASGAAHTEAELQARMHCTTPTASGVDFGTSHIVVASRTLSPASVGTDIIDDGTTITFLSKQRANCPDDPLPMPMTQNLAYLLPAGASRGSADRACTIARSCP